MTTLVDWLIKLINATMMVHAAAQKQPILVFMTVVVIIVKLVLFYPLGAGTVRHAIHWVIGERFQPMPITVWKQCFMHQTGYITVLPQTA